MRLNPFESSPPSPGSQKENTFPGVSNGDEEGIRYDWTTEEILKLLTLPLLDLIERAHEVHRRFHPHHKLQLATLLSIKTGGCPEDCSYCPQSRHFKTGVTPTPLISVEEVLKIARKAKEHGAERFCMGAAWREVRDGKAFERVLEMIRGVKSLGLETCVTLGMVTEEQAYRLKEAGLDAYNHNIDTSPEYYSKIITTRTFEDRLNTLKNIRKAGITVCCGGIIGMGESLRDRARMLEVLAGMKPHPESVPINVLVQVEGTPLKGLPEVKPFELVRMVATARILMPRSYVRLSAGRRSLTPETQALCFYAGANSIFYGEKLLTTPNAHESEDQELLRELGFTVEDLLS